MKKRILTGVIIFILILPLQVSGQSIYPPKTEKQREIIVWDLFTYVQKTPLEKISHKELNNKYLTYDPDDSVRYADRKSKGLFNFLLNNLDSTLDTLNLKEYDIVAWNKYTYPENLPYMLWQAEPVTHVFGQPLTHTLDDRSRRMEEGKKQTEHTLIVFKKDSPYIPRVFILFDENSNKIASWTLIKQGPLHYFISF